MHTVRYVLKFHTKHTVIFFKRFYRYMVFLKPYNDTIFSVLGNDILHQITAYQNHKLRIVLSDFDGITKHANYDTFHVGDEVSGYRLTIGGYSGDAGK